MSVLSAFLTALALAAPATLDGQRTAWHPLTVTFAGPAASETDSSPNPFLDIRLQVEFVGPENQRVRRPRLLRWRWRIFAQRQRLAGPVLARRRR